jgi:hypothetical protein
VIDGAGAAPEPAKPVRPKRKADAPPQGDLF